MKIGFVVNPVAGLGGRVGLKGTDGCVEEARRRGAEPRANDRATEALEAVRDGPSDVSLVTAGGAMGERAARSAGFKPTVVEIGGKLYETTAEDTRAAVRSFVDEGIELVVFVGGDGTAADVVDALDASDADVPVLGVPAGVKVYSSVFAHTPREAGRVAARFDGKTVEREVADIDEDAYRDDELRASVRAVVRVPADDAVQESKSRAGGALEGIALGFADDIRDDTTYVFGTGGTVAAIERALDIEPTLLGVDVWRDGRVVVRDGSEDEILGALGDHNLVVVSPLGGQGFVVGRGNQQISPEVLSRSELELVATRDKLRGLDALRIDTGDTALDEKLRGWRRVRVGRDEWRVERVV
ncbi:MAG: ATP-NAD kinase family protein [Halobacteriales archaeon]